MRESVPGPVAPLLSLKGIGKSFGPVRVLDDVSFDLASGEVHILAGENGAGKSTLIKILAGIHADYEGRIELGGRHIRFGSPGEAAQAGIAVIHQELSLVESMSVADNMHLGREASRLGGLWLDRKEQTRRTEEVCRRLDLGLSSRDLARPAGEFPLSVRNRIEIAKALAFEARILVMDEPTSALDRPDVEKLFALIEAAKRRGCGIIYISHKMEEIYRIADRITVLRDGKRVGSAAARDCPESELVRWMVGRELSRQFPARPSHSGPRPSGPCRLEVNRLRIPAADSSRRDVIAGLSFQVRPGEILGVAGLQGSGNAELFRGIFGAEEGVCEGEVRIDGVPFKPKDPRAAIRRGLVYLTADRKGEGLVLGLGADAYMTLASVPAISPGGFLRPGLERRRAQGWAESLRIRLSSVGQPVGTLSGGNQQKVLLAKWLGAEPRVLLLEDPTRGVDVGAKHDIYELIGRWTAEGMSILLISSELPELIGLSDRILVLHRGAAAAEFARKDAAPASILAAAMGS